MPHAPHQATFAKSGNGKTGEASGRAAIRVPCRRGQVLGLALLASTAALALPGISAAQSPGGFSNSSVVASSIPEPPSSVGDDTTGSFGATGSDVDGRDNTAESPADGAGARNKDDGEATGIRLGSFILKPSITQSLKSQKTTGNGADAKRSYLETSGTGTLTSDWARHELTIKGQGRWQKNLSGDLPTDSDGSLDADLRLDLSDQTQAHITGGYELGREDNTDPNAISGASTQSNVTTLRGGASIERDLGRLRGLVGADIARTTYSPAKFPNGTTLDLSDRDRNAYTLRGRIGYEISPALIPFIEASIGTTRYDQEQDTNGYKRSSNTYALRGGVAVDLGEKLRGEIGAGYETVTYDDSRLTEIGALSLEGSATWSPQRGTDLTAGLQTTVEDSTAPGESGAVVYRFTTDLKHELRDNLIAKLSGATTWRRYPSGSAIADSTAYTTGGGLAYRINRYLELEGTVNYEVTRRSTGNTTDLTTGIGLTLKR